MRLTKVLKGSVRQHQKGAPVKLASLGQKVSKGKQLKTGKHQPEEEDEVQDEDEGPELADDEVEDEDQLTTADDDEIMQKPVRLCHYLILIWLVDMY